MAMKLQLTLDSTSVEDCLDLVLDTRDYVDVVEVGYPLLVEEGLSLVHHVKHAFPEKIAMADVKIFHSGGYVARKCFDYGADVVSVLGLASDETFRAVLEVARARGGHVVGDLAGTENPVARALELEALGIEELVVPSGFGSEFGEPSVVSDADERDSPEPLQVLRSINAQLTDAHTAVVGRIALGNIDQVVAAGPSTILVGRAIVAAEHPCEAAAELKARMR